MKVLLIGVYPPPYGGVSVHIRRLQEQLIEKKIDCKVLDLGSKKTNKNILYLDRDWKELVTTKWDVIHIHISNISYKNMAGVIVFKLLSFIFSKKYIVTLHSLKIDIHKKGFFNILVKLFLHFNNRYIAVSSEVAKKLINLGVRKKYISIIPAFLPARVKIEELHEIPKPIWDFIDSHSPLISGNASQIAFHNSQDLYGIDMFVELGKKIAENYPNFGIIFCLPKVSDTEYYNKLNNDIDNYGIRGNFLFITSPYQFYPILMKSDILVRPTNTDGDAISIREALMYQVPVIASDVVIRPEGTILFKNRDVIDLTNKVNNLLKNYQKEHERLNKLIVNNYLKDILDVYLK